MKFYDLSFDEQIDELESMTDSINAILFEIEDDNPFKEELVDLMYRIWDEEHKIKNMKEKDNTNENLTKEYWKNQL